MTTTNFGTVYSGYIGVGDTPDGPAQRAGQLFVTTTAVTISSVGVWINAITGTPSALTVRIETDSSGLPSGTLAATGLTATKQESAVVSGAINTFSFTSPASILAGTYHIVVKTAETEIAVGNYYSVAVSSNSTNTGESEIYLITWSHNIYYDLYGSITWASGSTPSSTTQTASIVAPVLAVAGIGALAYLFTRLKK